MPIRPRRGEADAFDAPVATGQSQSQQRRGRDGDTHPARDTEEFADAGDAGELGEQRPDRRGEQGERRNPRPKAAEPFSDQRAVSAPVTMPSRTVISCTT